MSTSLLVRASYLGKLCCQTNYISNGWHDLLITNSNCFLKDQSKHVSVQSQLQKHYKKLWDMFKVNQKDTKMVTVKSFWSLYFSLHRYFTPFSIVSIVDLEQVNCRANFVRLITQPSHSQLWATNHGYLNLCQSLCLNHYGPMVTGSLSPPPWRIKWVLEQVVKWISL